MTPGERGLRRDISTRAALAGIAITVLALALGLSVVAGGAA